VKVKKIVVGTKRGKTMSNLSEEEIIDIVKKEITNTYTERKTKALQCLLDLYINQKEELEYYKQKEKDEFEERDRWE
jgi:hypothetical protein